jgi:hypothetical protein
MALPSFASANLNSAGYRLDQATPPGQPVPPPRLTDTFDILFHIAEVAAELRAAKWFASANIVKDNANAVIDAWLGDEPITREEARAQLDIVLAQALDSLKTMVRWQRDQTETARLHVRATAGRWRGEDWNAAEPERTCPELVALAVAGAG